MDTGMGDREPIDQVYDAKGVIIYKLSRAKRSHLGGCSMCNGEWNDGPCMVGDGIMAALDYLSRG